MKHFVQYHNSKEMGCSVSSLSEPMIYTDKSVSALPSNAVWVISGEGDSPKRFYLAAVFRVNRVSADCFDHPSFKNAAYGVGHIFGETIELNGLPWFEAMKTQRSNFRNGLGEISDRGVISELQALAGPHAL